MGAHMTMLERVARALMEADIKASQPDFPDMGEDFLRACAEAIFEAHHIPLAITVLKAMREPTFAMVEAPAFLEIDPGTADDVWRAMIDAAIQEHSTTPPRNAS